MICINDCQLQVCLQCWQEQTLGASAPALVYSYFSYSFNPPSSPPSSYPSPQHPPTPPPSPQVDISSPSKLCDTFLYHQIRYPEIHLRLCGQMFVSWNFIFECIWNVHIACIDGVDCHNFVKNGKLLRTYFCKNFIQYHSKRAQIKKFNLYLSYQCSCHTREVLLLFLVAVMSILNSLLSLSQYISTNSFFKKATKMSWSSKSFKPTVRCMRPSFFFSF